MSEELKIYTVGHSNLTAEDFFAMLRRHEIEVVADVRSVPYSKMCPQFDREMLQYECKSNKLYYGFFGHSLGARHTEPEALTDGQVDFLKVERLPAYNQGIERLVRGMPNYRIALMCSEADPLTCHRFGLIAHTLRKKGVSVEHIISEGLIAQSDLEKRLLSKYFKYINEFGEELTPVDQAFRILNKKNRLHVLKCKF